MQHLIYRRKFLLMGGLVAAGALCTGSIGTIFAAELAERAALDFVRRYSDNFFVRQAGGGVTRITAEVRDFSLFAEAFQSARRSGIEQMQAGGTISTFKIGRQTFELESLCPAEFATRKNLSRSL